MVKQTKIIIPHSNHVWLGYQDSINSKYGNTKVKIVQKWNEVRPPIPREFIEEFRTYLIQKRLMRMNKDKKCY